MRAPSPSRRYFLDWLRVGAFSLLILYHIGMFYVSWDWHVKSGHAPVAWLETPMALTNAWRLPLLFLVSGVVLRLALHRQDPGPLLKRRIVVLIVPFLFGMYVVCAPQAYHELVQKIGWTGSVAEFYRGYVDWPWASPEGWPIITPTWNHLWYLLYVLVYTCILVPALWIAGPRAGPVPMRAGSAGALMLAAPVLHLVVAALLHDSIGRAQTLWGDWYNLTASFLVMALGFAMADSPAFWARLRDLRSVTSVTAIALSVLVAVERNGLLPFDMAEPARFALRICQGWSVIWALLGWGQTGIDRGGPVLRYMSGAVFTWYVLHQTIIIAVGVPLSGIGLPLWAEAAALSLATVVLCGAGYEVARRAGRLGLLVGARTGRG